MRRNLLSSAFLALVLGILYLTTSSNSGGITGVSTVGCTCHGSSSNQTTMTLTGIPSTGWVAGTTYSMTLTVTNSGKSEAGFDLTVTQGTITNGSAGTTISGSGNELYHNTPQVLSSGTATWTFSWTAPSSGSSTLVTFHVSGNAVDGNNFQSNDQWKYLNFPFIQATSTATAPSISLTTITGISSTGATINGSGNANGANAGISVEYGLTTSYGSTQTATPAIITGTTSTGVSATLSGLSPSTTYHVRYKASNSAGTTYTSDTTFTTLGPAVSLPTLSIASIGAISTSGATVNGNANANNGSTTLSLEYGLTTSYGSSASVTPSPVSGNSATAVNGTLSGLTPNTLYHVRLKGVNSAGTAYSADSTFTTAALAPVITLLPVSNLTVNSATTNAEVTAQGVATAVSVEYGLTTSYGSTLNATPPTVFGNTPISVFAVLSGLSANTTYHYRYKAVNTGGTTYSPDATFTTKPSSLQDFEKAGLRLYPNPALNQFRIAGIPEGSAYSLQVYSLHGLPVGLTQQGIAGANIVVNCSALAAGYYCIVLKTEQATYQSVFQK